jgi:hypothetical protein
MMRGDMPSAPQGAGENARSVNGNPLREQKAMTTNDSVSHMW